MLLYMKNYVDLWPYLAEHFLKSEIFQTQFVKKIKALTLYPKNRAI